MLSGKLFTRDYLLEAIKQSQPWKDISDEKFADVRARLQSLAKNLTKHASPNEAQTERDFIYPVLEAIGWTDINVQPNLARRGRQVPDALLLASPDAKAKAIAEADQWKQFRHGLAILEAKRWERSLDRPSKGDEGVPAAQMLQYLSRADIETSNKLRLGILTNGQIWRLYWQGATSVSEDFFEIDLAKALQLPKHPLDLFDLSDERITADHCLRLFILLFGKQAFLPLEGALTFHDIARENGKTWEEKVTKDLSHLVFDELFPRLVTALAANDKKRPSPIDQAYLDNVRQSALVLLYRLLFVVYAEDRDLLPDNREPYKDFSLTAMRLEIAKRKADNKGFSSTTASYWPRLTAIFKAIDEGDNTFGIPPYNGGLFDKSNAPLLTSVALPDDILADVIYGLSHRVEDGQPRYINYRDLSVQQLGTVYERTLEYGLIEDDGKVIVNPDDAARHESGSYYTHESLVLLIIERTIGPFVSDFTSSFRVELSKLANDHRSKDVRSALLEKHDVARSILNLKICDPEMGSGHFLVSLVDWLADKVILAMAEAEQAAAEHDLPYLSPVAREIATVRVDIIRHANENNWPYVDEYLQDRHIVRRMVLKRCVYGVDKNPLAVELAKVALWLHTFTVGAPLSFLDHHLRCGDSLFGAWVRPAMDKLVELGGPLLMEEPKKRALGAASAMQNIERLSDADIAEAYQSKNLFDGVKSMTSELSGLLTLVHSLDWQGVTNKLGRATAQALVKGTFGDPVKISTLATPLKVPPAPVETEIEKQKREITGDQKYNEHELATTLSTWLPNLATRSTSAQFLHWQVAFPGIWRDWEQETLVGGFDAIIGNPPYVRQELIKAIKPQLKRTYPDTYDGAADLYVYFYDQGLRLLKPGGRLSYVVTNKWMKAGYAEGLRDLFTSQFWVEFVADFGHAKKFFTDADVFPSIVVVRKPHADGPAPDSTKVCVIPRDDVPEKHLDQAVERATYSLSRSHFDRDTWMLEAPEVVSLLTKRRKAGAPLKSYLSNEPYYGIKTGLNEAFLINSATRDQIVAIDQKAAALIKPYLRGQDLQRWTCPDTGLYMIVMKSSENYDWPWSKCSDPNKAEDIFKATYPSIHQHFKPLEEFIDPKTRKARGLRHREDQGRFWWELRSCAYYEAFANPKILYQVIQFYARYSLDTDGRLSNDKTFFIPSDDLWLLTVLNSPVMWWHNWRYLTHLKDEALSPMGYKVETLPIPTPTSKAKDIVGKSVPQLISHAKTVTSARAAILDWLRFEFEIDKPNRQLTDVANLDVDNFLSAVRDHIPKKRDLGANDLTRLRREHRAIIEPARSARNNADALERAISDLVCNSFGLTPQETDLMWRTAPPRMPFLPPQYQHGSNTEPGLPEDDD